MIIMKGISLAIQTVIIFILAAAVVAIVLYFFISGTGESISLVNARSEQATGCTSYSNRYDNCNRGGDNFGADFDNLAIACASLSTEYPACAFITTASTVAQKETCFLDCCKDFCPP